MSHPIFLALACIVAWSFLAVVAKLAQSNLDHFQFLFWSNVLSSIVVGICYFLFTPKTSERVKPTFAQLGFTALLGFLGCFLYYLLLYYGYATASGVEVLIVQYSWPALIALFAVMLLGERMCKRKGLSVFLGFLAMLVVVTKGDWSQFSLDNQQPLLVVLIGAASFALFSVLSKKETLPPMQSTTLYFVWASIYSFIAMCIWSEFVLPDTRSLFVLCVNGALINGLSYILWIIALSKTDASRLAPLVYLSPVLAVIWLVLFLDEPFYTIYIVGISLSIASGLLTIGIREQPKVTSQRASQSLSS